MKPATDRLKLNPQLGRMPTLQFCRPSELRVDAAYQRDLHTGPSQSLIRRIAQHWNWDLCQPLVVARRVDVFERLFVIDGQHRLAAARLRGDIEQLPCVIVSYASVADEAASFVHLNQQRRPLSRLDLFKAAVASDDTRAVKIVAALADARLSVAPHSNYSAWKPGMVANIGGIESAWRVYGEKVTSTALRLLGLAFGGQVLRYAGTIFPGVAAVCADETVDGTFAEDRFERFQTMLAMRSQVDWRNEVGRVKADNPGLRFDASSALAIRRAWALFMHEDVLVPQTVEPTAAPKAPLIPGGKPWCDQCEMRVSAEQASNCKSRYCSLKVAA